MSKFIQTDYGNKKEILKFPDHYVAIAVTVDDSGVSPGPDGRKIVPAGTIIGGGFLADETKKAVKSNNSNAEGVLMNDVDVTYGPAPGAAIVHGFIDKNKLPEPPDAAAVAALKMIQFIA